MSEPVAEVTEDLNKVKVSDDAGLYTSDSRGSDEAGEGTYKVPFKTVMKVRFSFWGVPSSLLDECELNQGCPYRGAAL